HLAAEVDEPPLSAGDVLEADFEEGLDDHVGGHAIAALPVGEATLSGAPIEELVAVDVAAQIEDRLACYEDVHVASLGVSEWVEPARTLSMSRTASIMSNGLVRCGRPALICSRT